MIKSFEPISNIHITVLILGTIPGVKSLQVGEYYANPTNKFWSIISTITKNEIPLTYADKKELLLKTGIGIWDVVHTADRKGSLDMHIKNAQPNNLTDFIAAHQHLKTIAFNGKKAQVLFDRHFKRDKEINYLTLPSTSAAHTTMNFEKKCQLWLLNNKKVPFYFPEL